MTTTPILPNPPRLACLLSSFVLLTMTALSSATDTDQLYQRRATWPATMLATRTNCCALPAPASDKQLSHVWAQMEADFRDPCGQLKTDAGRTYLDYFKQRSGPQFERRLLQTRLGRLGAARVALTTQMDKLNEAETDLSSPRWLELYQSACLATGCHELVQQIWLGELRDHLDQQIVDALRQEDFGGQRWRSIRGRAKQIVRAIPAGRLTWVSQFPEAIKALKGNYSSGFAAAGRAGDTTAMSRWIQSVAALPSGQTDSISELKEICEEIQACQKDILAGLVGMSEWLATPAHEPLIAEWSQQYTDLESDIENASHFAQVADEVYRSDALIEPTDRDPLDVVLRRTAALLGDQKRLRTGQETDVFERRLAALQRANQEISVELTEARRVLYADACRLRREIALRNPLLDFTDILFIKRHRALFNHMCDQYYGMAATPGGGLYVLKDAFGSSPQVRDVLAESVVGGAGRLAGQALQSGHGGEVTMRFDGQGNRTGIEGSGGTFLSPELSSDGQRILFAYVENRGDMLHDHHVDPSRGHWAPGRCYHIFSVNLDGSQLSQLTDGTFNDFDPCWLPNGRIAFVSERRGGYLRCGRACPNYTLFDMQEDGNDIQCLSFHETNEWHPSVTNDGMIIWTRWDYVDRHGCTAHMPWLTTLDGRDPRPVHGNYAPRRTRPDMELDCRAIPGSHKFIATAAPHHGQSYGSLVLIDPHVADDDGMGPVRRITPEVGFPETQGGGQVYGTAWPLSEDYYLCVYDADMRPGGGRQGGGFLRGNYGIYLVDSFGNRELLYRDPSIASLSPIPVRARPAPPVPTELAKRGNATNPAARSSQRDTGESTGTVAVMDVYDSLLPWPADTKITSLRVLQVFPMSVPSGRPPHETGLRVAKAGDSVVPVRHVLGTVPVEEDGSVYFEVPANRELFFQALDEQGLAVQSMRSATHVREGENLACAGCHNPRHHSTPRSSTMPLALKRPPSQLKPDVSGSRPFSYPLLVQPVLDKHCVKCHQQNADAAPNLAREPITNRWFASYNNLVRKYAFYDYQDEYRTIPGRFGARASRLYELLQAGHYDVRLNEEEMHRITLWLDCASMFYGVYEEETGRAQLAGELAYPTLESP